MFDFLWVTRIYGCCAGVETIVKVIFEEICEAIAVSIVRRNIRIFPLAHYMYFTGGGEKWGAYANGI